MFETVVLLSSTAPSMCCSLTGRYPELHCSWDPQKGWLYPSVRLVVRGGHHVRDVGWSATVHGSDPLWDSAQDSQLAWVPSHPPSHPDVSSSSRPHPAVPLWPSASYWPERNWGDQEPSLLLPYRLGCWDTQLRGSIQAQNHVWRWHVELWPHPTAPTTENIHEAAAADHDSTVQGTPSTSLLRVYVHPVCCSWQTCWSKEAHHLSLCRPPLTLFLPPSRQDHSSQWAPSSWSQGEEESDSTTSLCMNIWTVTNSFPFTHSLCLCVCVLIQLNLTVLWSQSNKIIIFAIQPFLLS